MAQYIDKDALVAEIKRRISNLEQLWKLGNKKYIETHFTGQFRDIKVYEGIIDFINTLEVKEVDLNDEKCEYFNNDGNCIYALNKTGKVMRCQYINCYRKIKAQKGE